MHRIGFLCLLLLIPPAAAAADNSKDLKSDKAKEAEKDLTPAEQFNALKRDFQAKQMEVYRAYGKAKTPEERRKLIGTLPKADEYARKAMALAEGHPKEPFATDALLWVVELGPTQERDQAVGTLMDQHIDSDKLGTLADVLGRSRSPDTPAKLKTLINKSPHKEVQGQATYALANYLRNETYQETSAEKLKVLNREAESLLEQIVHKYGDVKRYGTPLAKSAEADLFEIQHLSIGMPVPEVAGKDVDGKEFKLSDYRGKVLLLDFWGNW